MFIILDSDVICNVHAGYNHAPVCRIAVMAISCIYNLFFKRSHVMPMLITIMLLCGGKPPWAFHQIIITVHPLTTAFFYRCRQDAVILTIQSGNRVQTPLNAEKPPSIGTTIP